MRLVVCVKQVRILSDEIELTSDGRDVDPDFVDTALNEWDACAIEEALRIRERHGSEDGEVVAVSAGGDEAEAALRRCLAMGADRGIRVALADVPDAIGVARALAPVVAAERPDLVLCGVQSSDAGQAATGTALAGLLELPCVAVVTGIDWDPPARRASVRRELEGGLVELVELETPALLTVQTGINAPRYVTFRAVKQAEAQPLAVVEPQAPAAPAARVQRLFVPEREGGAEMLEGDPAEIARRIAEIVRERLA